MGANLSADSDLTLLFKKLKGHEIREVKEQGGNIYLKTYKDGESQYDDGDYHRFVLSFNGYGYEGSWSISEIPI